MPTLSNIWRFRAAQCLVNGWAMAIWAGASKTQPPKQKMRLPILQKPLTSLVLLSLIVICYGPLATAAAAPAIPTANIIEPPLENLPVTTPKPKRTFRAFITQYSRVDSCHTVRNGKCIMASGKEVYVGAAACPYSLRLGTQVMIDGEPYACEDRYAAWLDHARGLPTVDVFVESNPHGNSVRIVTVNE
jgi:hypothetical protein